jgi:hypothetical protein
MEFIIVSTSRIEAESLDAAKQKVKDMRRKIAAVIPVNKRPCIVSDGALSDPVDIVKLADVTPLSPKRTKSSSF